MPTVSDSGLPSSTGGAFILPFLFDMVLPRGLSATTIGATGSWSKRPRLPCLLR